MKFSKTVPAKWDLYWVVNRNYPDPFPAFVWTETRYPFLHHISAPCKKDEVWIGEHAEFLFGDRIEKPLCKDNILED